MGVAAQLFFNPTDRENTLAYRVRPSDEQVESQQERWNDLADELIAKLRKDTGKPVSSWLQGSYKFSTQIRPARDGEEFDIDLGVYVEWPGTAETGSLGPVELKNKVQQILEAYAEDEANDATGVVESKTRCNRVYFDDSFHIDVPSYHLDREADSRDLATEDDAWELSDPKAIYVWWKEQFEGDVRDTARRLVRYMKMWAALKFHQDSRPSSIVLTVLVAEALLGIDIESLDGDDELLTTVVVEIEKRLKKSSTVSNPVNLTENLNRLTDTAKDNVLVEMGDLKRTCYRAIAATDELESADIWSEVFAHFFPFPSQDDELLVKTEGGAVAPIRYNPNIKVIASAGQRRWENYNGIGPIPKGCDIEFRVVNFHELPFGSTIHWTVRNEGAEAESTNDLGHSAGTGLVREESSAYRGTHFMDVVVKLNGKIVGRRRVRVQVSGLGVPKRNPGRPAWTKLR
jgi:hypothetical protein